MPIYDMECTACDIYLENALMSYEEMGVAICPVCGAPLYSVPGRFSFDVQDSRKKRRQTLEKRFKKREKRIESTFTPAQKDRLGKFCDKYSARRRY